MRKFYKLALLAALLGLTISAQANLIPLFNTGVDAGGVVLANGTTPDPHYSLIAVPSGSSATLVLSSAGGFPIGPWLGDNALSRWIRPNNGGTSGQDSDPAGTYVFRTTFDLTGLNPLTASISGGWSTDNNGSSVLLNGVNTGIAATSFTQFQTGFAPFTISSGFVAGINTLDFVVVNGAGTSGNPTGLRVEMTGNAAVAPVPEPSTYIAGALLAIPFGLQGIRCLRNRKQA
jgi:hypothetical protein